VPTYRLYRLDGAGKIVAAGWIEADHDEAAMLQAQDELRLTGGSYELWERNRLVGKNGGGRH
jgi:hypothetical protein